MSNYEIMKLPISTTEKKIYMKIFMETPRNSILFNKLIFVLCFRHKTTHKHTENEQQQQNFVSVTVVLVEIAFRHFSSMHNLFSSDENENQLC